MSERRPYRVEIAPAAQRELRRLGHDDAARLRGTILTLCLEPRTPAATRLVGSELWRLRVGDVRVVYAIRDAESLVVVLRVAARGAQPYRRLRGG